MHVTGKEAILDTPSTPREGAAPVHRRAGRPPTAVLGQKQITRGALKLINRDGYKGLTMAALARQLNVAPSALYNHVTSKQEVLALVEDHLMGSVDVSGFATLPWADAVKVWARSYRATFAEHVPLIPVIALLPITDAPRTVRMYEAVASGFGDAGWQPETILNVIVAFESFIFGSAYDANAPEDIFDVGALATASPALSAAVAARSGHGSRVDADAAFEAGLDALVTGFAVLLQHA
ncbi:MAG: TetR/AcrR family transcriptional regulator [Acidobacteria bacterium]|nr:TetR/AcrR family transcriptional regulator [Acidobacteriota bacterium]